MAKYKYSATDAVGKINKGLMEAENPEDLREKLRKNDLFMVDCSISMNTDLNLDFLMPRKMKVEDLTSFCREMCSMLGSGVNMVRALNILAKQDSKPYLKKCYTKLATDIKHGTALSDAMASQGSMFPELLVAMIRAGEASGKIDQTFEKMGEHFDKSHKLKSQIKSAMTYPMVLLVLIIVVIIALFTFVMPQFGSMLAETKVPKITVIMMAISDFCVKNFLWILLAIAALVIIVVFVFRIPAVKVFKDRFLVKCPKLGPLMKIIVTADFARTIASLYSSGMTIVNAMQCSKETINNRYVRSQFASAVKSIRAGKSLSQAIRDVDGFDKKLADTIEIGEETGKLDDMLNMAADTYEYDSQAAIKRLTGILEPLMIVIMAGVVVVVMLSVLMPMFNMYGSIDENSEAIFSYLSQILF
ncbi:MAG: type II secretion system F family protein [Oscillospiraceae bacterium]|nr:type II secretion system F family protein [Oscillospiraceae bacterium]MDD6086230.1 type II secretion system F family protein [Oscillospiraceae bacterium]MDY3257245.1 type II secretion system F family protein [Ruminococcus callidus]